MIRIPSRLAAGLLAASVLAAATPVALAGVFSVTPVRIYMAPRDRAVAVTLTNEGDSANVLQAELHTWTQDADGTDRLTPTDDLILSPPIIKLAPRARQVVRLALLRAPDPARQLTYRLIVREVPEALEGAKGIQVPIALALSMPVFITPPKAQRAMACSLVPATPAAGSASTAPSLPAPAPQVRCANSGNAYAQIRQIVLQRGNTALARFEGGSYVLPGAAQTLTLKAEQAVAPGAAELSVSFDDGQNQVFSVVLP